MKPSRRLLDKLTTIIRKNRKGVVDQRPWQNLTEEVAAALHEANGNVDVERFIAECQHHAS